MNCFNHSELPAIGLCKYCCKGLCGPCAQDSKFGISCSTACQKQLQESYDRVTNSSSFLPSMFGVLSILGITAAATFDFFTPVGLAMLVLSLVSAIAFIRSAKALVKNRELQERSTHSTSRNKLTDHDELDEQFKTLESKQLDNQ